MIADRIIELRKGDGMTQTQLASKLNISASAVGMYEQGRRVPSIDMLIRMSKIFDVSLDYLITGSEHRQSGRKEAISKDNCPCNTCYWKNCKGT